MILLMCIAYVFYSDVDFLINLNMCLQVRHGVHPVVSDVHAVRTLFSGPPLGIKKMYADQMVSSK